MSDTPQTTEVTAPKVNMEKVMTFMRKQKFKEMEKKQKMEQCQYTLKYVPPLKKRRKKSFAAILAASGRSTF